MALDLVHELLALTAALEAASVPYALCGGLAVAVHGAPRATTDIDLVLAPADVDRALDAARSLGFRFRASPMSFPDGMRIDRVTRVADGESLTLDLIQPGGDLALLLRDRERIELRDSPLWVLSRQALLAMKIAAGRPQDLADVARLEGLDR